MSVNYYSNEMTLQLNKPVYYIILVQHIFIYINVHLLLLIKFISETTHA